MPGTMETDRRAIPWRVAGWSMAAFILLLPLVAMQFTGEVRWTAGDFIFAGLLIGGVGMAFELAVRMSSSWSYRAGAALGLGTGFLLIWANGAVGYIGSEDNPYNLTFFGVIAVAFVGAVLAGFRAKGVAIAMLAAAIAHAAIGLGGLAEDPRTGPITLVFVSLWLASAALFRKAAREKATA